MKLSHHFAFRTNNSNFKKFIKICLKLVRIILETWYVSTHTYLVPENIPFSTKTTLILLMSAFFCKKKTFSVFFEKESTFTESNSMRVVLEAF